MAQSPSPLYLHGEVSSGVVIVGVGKVRVPVVLGLLEVVQHLVVAPAGVAVRLPHLVVLPVAPDVQHVVEDGRAAHDLASGPVAPAVDVTDAGATCEEKRQTVFILITRCFL